jgi:hypothetical protein
MLWNQWQLMQLQLHELNWNNANVNGHVNENWNVLNDTLSKVHIIHSFLVIIVYALISFGMCCCMRVERERKQRELEGAEMKQQITALGRELLRLRQQSPQTDSKVIEMDYIHCCIYNAFFDRS